MKFREVHRFFIKINRCTLPVNDFLTVEFCFHASGNEKAEAKVSFFCPDTEFFVEFPIGRRVVIIACIEMTCGGNVAVAGEIVFVLAAFLDQEAAFSLRRAVRHPHMNGPGGRDS